MRRGFDPRLIKAASLQVRSRDMEKEAILNMLPQLGARIAPMVQRAGSALSGFGSRAVSGGVQPFVGGYRMASQKGANVLQAAGKGLRRQAAYMTAGGSEKAFKASQGALNSAVQAAGSGTKLVGGTLGAGMFVSALPQAAAHGRQGYNRISEEYGNQGGF